MSGDRYEVMDLKTRVVVGTYRSARTARRKADKLDLAHGAVRYTVRVIWEYESIPAGEARESTMAEWLATPRGVA